jgi:glycosyltransferase involved in cell wall biosynthesis
MNIGVDCKTLFKGKTGIAVYIAKTLDKIQEIDRTNNYFLFERQPSSYRVTNPRFKKVLIRSRLPGTVWLMAVLPFHLRRHLIDVFWGPEQVIPCLVRTTAVKMVSTVLDVTVIRYPRTMRFHNYLINKFFLKKSLKRSRKVIAISRCIKTDICSLFPREVTPDDVVPVYLGKPEWNDVDQGTVPREAHLLFVGNFEPRKNLPALLKALVILRERNGLTVPVRFVGPPGWKTQKTGRYIDDHGLGGQITFAGYVDEQELIREYKTCRALVYPSLYEGFGLPVLEALLTDTLVLSSRGTAMEEIAGECIVLFDPRDPRDIADKILMIHDRGFQRQRYLSGKDMVLERFSWKKTAEQTLAVLNDAYARPARLY